MKLSKIQRKRENNIDRLKYAQQNFFCISVDVYRKHQSDDFDETYKVLTELKKQEIKNERYPN